MVIPAASLVVAVNAHAWDAAADEVNPVFELIAEFVLPEMDG